MKRISKKELCVIIAVVVAILLLGVPAIISAAYMFGLRFQTPPNTIYGGSDLLVYWGTIVSFIGTITLGIIAYSQNKRITLLQESARVRQDSCNIILEACDEEKICYDEKNYSSEEVRTDLEKRGYAVNSIIACIAQNFSDAVLQEVCVYYTYTQSKERVPVRISASVGRNQCKQLQIPMIDGCLLELTDIEFLSCYAVSTYGSFRFYPIANQQSHRSAMRYATISDYQFYGISGWPKREAVENDNTEEE